MRQGGYYTGYVGKWHLGPVPEGLFDNDKTCDGQGEFWSEEYPPEQGSHLTDRLGNQAVDMIHEAPAGQPFAITVGFKAPHVQDEFHPVEPYPASPSTAVLYERDEPENWRTEFFYEHHSFRDRIPRTEGIRTRQYKYLRYLDSDPLFEELYDLEHDPDESVNLAVDPDYSHLLQEMRSKWSRQREAVRL